MNSAVTDRGGLLESPVGLAILYVAFGGVWVLATDWVVATALGVSELTLQAQFVKGLVFVAGSGLFIYALIAGRERLLREQEATLRDEHARVEALESDVRSSERFLRLVLGNISETVLLTDEDGAFTYVCPNVSYIFGYDPEEVHRMGSIDALLSGECHQKLLDAEADPADGPTIAENVECEITDADGAEHVVLVTARSVTIEAGARLYTIRDITERRAQARRFQTYVENSSDVLVLIDSAGRMEYVSPSVESIFGFEPAEVVGADAFEFVHPDDEAELRGALDQIDEQPPGTTVTTRYRTRHADGSWVWVESRVTVREEKEDRYVVNARDITDLREQEGRLSVLDRVLRHNLRNRLNVVLGYAERLQESADAETSEDAAAITDACEDLLELSEKARQFDASVRPRSARLPLDLTESVKAVLADQREVYDGLVFDATLPDNVLVRADETIELALVELFENAAKHCDGRTTVEVDLTVHESTVALTIADDGPGMPEMDQRVIREGAETPLEHGTGVGLWLVRWTVENNDGSLEVRDNDPTGTVVEIRLPRAS